MQKKIIFLIVTVLVISGLILGFKIYQREKERKRQEEKMRQSEKRMEEENDIYMKSLSRYPLDGEGVKGAAIVRAKEIFNEKKAEGVDMSNGPCLGRIGKLPEMDTDLSDWVVDVAHSPRRPEDDRPENQCREYREGKAKHFVELDENGNLIRAQ